MTYFEGFVVPVPEANEGAYRKHSADFAPVLQGAGVKRMVETWESDVPEGKLTDFRKAVDARPAEKIVFSWFEYPDRAGARCRECENDERSAHGRDGQGYALRRQAHDHGRVRCDRRRRLGRRRLHRRLGGAGTLEQARRLSRARLEKCRFFREYGATRIVEAWGDDVSKGEVTDFFRAVKAEDGENVVFAFIEWPDKQTRDSAWEKIMKDERMQPRARCRSTASACSGVGSRRSSTPPQQQPAPQASAPVNA